MAPFRVLFDSIGSLEPQRAAEIVEKSQRIKAKTADRLAPMEQVEPKKAKHSTVSSLPGLYPALES